MKRTEQNVKYFTLCLQIFPWLLSLYFRPHREDHVITAWKDTLWMSNAEWNTDSVRSVWQVTNQLAEKVLSPLLLLLLLPLFLFPPYLTSVQLPLIRAFTDDGIKMAPEPRQLMRCHWQGRSFMHNSVCQNLSFIFCLDSQSLFNTLSAFTPVDRPSLRFKEGHWVDLFLA